MHIVYQNITLRIVISVLFLIDVTLDQYCDSNYDAGDVRTSFGPQNSINDINIYECGNTPYNNI